jgi:hypothetical protein
MIRSKNTADGFSTPQPAEVPYRGIQRNQVWLSIRSPH